MWDGQITSRFDDKHRFSIKWILYQATATNVRMAAMTMETITNDGVVDAPVHSRRHETRWAGDSQEQGVHTKAPP